MGRVKHLSPLILSAFLVLIATTTLLAASLEGEWDLVEQHYGTGRANLLDQEEPLSLEIQMSDGRLMVKIRVSGDNPAIYDWPALPNEAGPLPVTIEERKEDLQKGSITVRYRVKPAPEDELILSVFEEYSITEDGNALVGKMEVTFMLGEAKRGSFVLHRRFERKK